MSPQVRHYSSSLPECDWAIEETCSDIKGECGETSVVLKCYQSHTIIKYAYSLKINKNLILQ